VKAPKTSGGRRTPVRHTIPLGIVIFLVFSEKVEDGMIWELNGREILVDSRQETSIASRRDSRPPNSLHAHEHWARHLAQFDYKCRN